MRVKVRNLGYIRRRIRVPGRGGRESAAAESPTAADAPGSASGGGTTIDVPHAPHSAF